MTDELNPAENDPSKHALHRQFLRFAGVGVVGTAVHYAAMFAAVELLHVSPVIGSGIGFLVSLGASYALNRMWTFDKRPPWARGFLVYFLVCAVGLAINMGIVALGVSAGLHYMVAQVIATPVALLWNFFSSRFIVFR